MVSLVMPVSPAKSENFLSVVLSKYVDFPPPENKIVLEGAKLVSFSSAGV